ncbi:uncharacterized protein Gasu_52720 [Galdieria sulphuraria]|uniref:Protein YIPF n=1 Tax=Galdieria sulphuraria TaxID=130081 RepID=M2WTE6_GALSU|nr:uncharacterized protein Gasu_52720 [Galdieria sulphuraria]EME27170.1 hypothetical protein Gasu_52720 [Galdieria sulphuraria]|eukprot:XP_005703690.1 hypothetical protein Gasu_52720 [Galdieria sulphuraria]
MDTTEESTLDEPVWSTIKRDLGLIGRRLKLVILPKVTAVEMQAELRDWDLWGPLFICMTLATVLSVEASEDASLIFSLVFLIIWCGSFVVTLNAQLLGGAVSFFMGVCLLGYCVFPLLVGAFFCIFWTAVLPTGVAVVLRFVTVVLLLIWSIMAVTAFFADVKLPEGRKLLAVYPVFLFYSGIAWMILVGFQEHK